MRNNLLLFTDLGIQLALTALPLIAAMLFAARLGVRKVSVLLAIGLAGSGLTAMLAFWAFYVDPIVGKSFSYFLVFGSVLLIARDAELGAARGRVAEMEAQSGKLLNAAARLRGLLPSFVWSAVAALRRLRS